MDSVDPILDSRPQSRSTLTTLYMRKGKSSGVENEWIRAGACAELTYSSSAELKLCFLLRRMSGVLVCPGK